MTKGDLRVAFFMPVKHVLQSNEDHLWEPGLPAMAACQEPNLRDGKIVDLAEGRSQLPQAQDLGGDFLLPGLVELHTDNLEKHMTPRPGVDWPSTSAVLSHDAQIIAAGITTVLDANSLAYSDRYRAAIVEHCLARGLSVASHDDATLAHVQESARYGMTIAEFPTTLEAAKGCQALDMKVLMGAPNVVRGGSHSGNVAAASLAAEGLLDILSSDYYPASLLQAAFVLADQQDDGDLSRAVKMISLAPAKAAGLGDRGEIAIGLRADLVQARSREGLPVVQQVWRQAKRVF